MKQTQLDNLITTGWKLANTRPYSVFYMSVDILLGLKARVNNLAVAPMQVNVSEAATTLVVVLHLPTRPFFCLV